MIAAIAVFFCAIFTIHFPVRSFLTNYDKPPRGAFFMTIFRDLPS